MWACIILKKMYMLKREHIEMECNILVYMQSAANRKIGVADP